MSVTTTHCLLLTQQIHKDHVRWTKTGGHLLEADTEAHGADRVQETAYVRAPSQGRWGDWPGAGQARRASEGLGLVQEQHEATGFRLLSETPTSPISTEWIPLVSFGTPSYHRLWAPPMLATILALLGASGDDSCISITPSV